MALANLVGSVEFSTVRAPNNGTKVVAVSATEPPPNDEGPVRPALQELTNRDTWLQHFGGTWSPPAQFGSLALNDKVTIKGLPSMGTLFVLGPTEFTLSGLGNDQWTYVYAYLNAGVVTMEASTTAPTADLRFKTGDSSRRYVGVCRTNNLGQILPIWATRGRYVLHRPLSVSVTTGADWTDMTVPLPPHVRSCRLRLATIFANPDDVIMVRAKGNADTTWQTLPNKFTYQDYGTVERIDVVTDASQIVQVKLSSGGAGSLTFYVVTFDE